MSTAGNCVCQIDACAGNECFPPWSAGKPANRITEKMLIFLSATKAFLY